MTELIIQPQYPLRCANYPVGTVVVLGCGGTGSYLIPLLARSISTLARKVKFVLIDGDTVEDKNLKRQNFVAPDIGQNKAEVMGNRYSALGIEISTSKKYLENAQELVDILSASTNYGGHPLIVSCVDNAKTRMLVREAIRTYGVLTYWIDTGNEEFDGQVVLSCSNIGLGTKESLTRGLYPMPDVFDLYPDLVEKAKQDKLPTELSCAELAASSPQYGFVNATSANLAMNYVHDLLTGRPIKTHAVSFSVANTFSSMPLTENEIHSWTDFFEPMKGQRWLKDAVAARLAKQAEREKLNSPEAEAKQVARSLLDLLGKKPAPTSTSITAELVEMMSSKPVYKVRVGNKTMV